jgi:hypothetical protein
MLDLVDILPSGSAMSQRTVDVQMKIPPLNNRMMAWAAWAILDSLRTTDLRFTPLLGPQYQACARVAFTVATFINDVQVNANLEITGARLLNHIPAMYAGPTGA